MSTPVSESITQKTTRKSKNCWAGFMACCSDTKESAAIKRIEYNITARQRQFGEEYLKLHDKGATEEELQACVDKAKSAVAKLKEDISKHEAHMDETREDLEKKIEKDPMPPAAEEQAIASDLESTPAAAPAE